MDRADLVLEGGGVKGLGLVGAVVRLMREGYSFQRVAGTSAGAIVAALLAAGATYEQLIAAMGRLDYRRVPDPPRPGIPVLSEGISLMVKGGAFKGDYIDGFVRDELQRLGVRTFRDLRRTDQGADRQEGSERKYKLVVMATDVTRGRLLRLPWDYEELLGRPADDQLVADAVRASIAIPLFFEPVTVSNEKTGVETTLVDGGILSNFPIEIFDRTDGEVPRWPTLGVKVMPALPIGDPELFPGLPLPTPRPLHLVEQVLATAIVGHDQTYLERPCVRRRAIQVDTRAVGIVEFDADEKKREAVVASGDEAARRFLAGWSWERFKAECRGVKDQ